MKGQAAHVAARIAFLLAGNSVLNAGPHATACQSHSMLITLGPHACERQTFVSGQCR
jgi:hypothetical protein